MRAAGDGMDLVGEGAERGALLDRGAGQGRLSYVVLGPLRLPRRVGVESVLGEVHVDRVCGLGMNKVKLRHGRQPLRKCKSERREE